MKAFRVSGLLHTGGALAFAAGLAILIPQCILFPEDQFSGDRVPNMAPSVNITGGVLRDSLDTESQVRFYWYGADEDGVIRWFEWAVDDTVSQDAWHRTTRFDEEIRFEASTLDEVTAEYGDWHTFYIRAVDDQYARSVPDKRLFNAHTIAPTSEIESPTPTVGASWASALRMTWRGEDLDASSADNLPEWFEIKLVGNMGSLDITNEAAIRRAFENRPNLLLGDLDPTQYPDTTESDAYFRAQRAWLRVPGNENERWLENMSGSVGFAVRAIDEAGAMEQKFQLLENWVIFRISPQLIDINFSEPSLGAVNFRSSAFPYEAPWEITVAPNQQFRFEWTGDASAAGTEAGPCNYGFDIPDPEDPAEPFLDPQGRGGWVGWAIRDRMQAAMSFPPSEMGKVHYFYFKMVDISTNPETETRGLVEINVAQFDFANKFLLVDDQKLSPIDNNNHRPNDALSDAWQGRVFASVDEYLGQGEQLDILPLYDDGDSQFSAIVPDSILQILGHYQTVIWDCAGQPRYTGLRAIARSGELARYVGLGGNLLLMTTNGPVAMIDGTVTDENTLCNDGSENDPDLTTAGDPWSIHSFLWRQLHLRGCVSHPRGSPGTPESRQERIDNSMWGADAANPLYPDLDLDLDRFDVEGATSDPAAGNIWFECLGEYNIDQGLLGWYEREDGLEVIYNLRTQNNEARLLGRPVAWRTSATEEDIRDGLDRGRIVCYSFHPYYFKERKVRDAMTWSINWLMTGLD